jgi:alcohol dehydrogenase class IV
MRFEFATAGRIIFGPGTLAEIGTLVRGLGRHALVVTGGNPDRAAGLLARLRAADVVVTTYGVRGEPSVESVTRGAEIARAAGCDCVLGFGGGSAIDAAKGIAGLVPNPGDPLDYLEVIGRALPLTNPALPVVAIPTTAGTGAEVTRNAVLCSPSHRVKVSLRSVHLLPRIALVDPELTYDLPAALTASTGLDALTQLIEPYVSSRTQPLTDALCVEGIRRAARSLRTACEQPRHAAAREDMAVASLFGGIALANSGLGAAHGFAAPIGGRFEAPHGAVCAALLPGVLAANVRALRQRAATSRVLPRFDEVARLLTGRADANIHDGVRWLRDLVHDLKIPTLRAYGLTSADVPALVAAAAQASSMKANPLPLTTEELTEILAGAL